MIEQALNIAGITIVGSISLAFAAATTWLCIVVYKDIKKRLNENY